MDSQDIFKQAAKQSTQKLSDKQKKEIEVVKEEKQKQIAEERTETDFDATWQKVENAMTGPLAERFLNCMQELPDRDFVRTYLKTLEYFKPKIIREEKEKKKEEDLTINVTIVEKSEDGNFTELNFNKEKNSYEQS